MINPVYEDNHIIVVVKPANVLTQGDITGDVCLLDMVKDYVKVKYNKPGNVYLGMVHRLDRPVGGLIVFARTSKAAARLTDDIKKDRIHREYTAVVHGETPPAGILTDYLLKDGKTNMVKAFDTQVEGSKKAVLDFETLEYNGGMSKIKIVLHTGRSHQIRVQMAAFGHPIYGDMRYGRGEKGNIALFCSRLDITHPTKKEVMSFTAVPVSFPF